MARQEFGILRTRSLSGVVNDLQLGSGNNQEEPAPSIQEKKKIEPEWKFDDNQEKSNKIISGGFIVDSDSIIGNGYISVDVEPPKYNDPVLEEQPVVYAKPIEKEENTPVQEANNNNKRATHKIIKVLKGVQKVTTSLLALIGVTAITITLDEHMRAIGVDAETSNIIGVSTVAIAYIMGLSPFIRTLYKEALSTTTAPQEDTSQQEVKIEEKSNDKEALRMGRFR